MWLATIGPDRDRLVIAEGGGAPTSAHAMWLRDACVCPECRRPATNERLLDSTKIDASITIVDSAITDHTLTVILSDGHTVTISTEWLATHLASMTPAADPAQGRRCWMAGDDLALVDRVRLDTPDGLIHWIDTVVERGAAVVRGVDSTELGLRSVAELIGEVRATNYGVLWEIEATVEPVSAVESEHHLSVHTDLPYRSEAPGLQLLLASVVDVEGGASTLVDGYAVAEDLRRADADAWELLTRIEFTYPYVRDDVEIRGRAPLIGVRSNGCYGEIRRAPDLVGVPLVDAAQAPALYAALRIWTELVDDPGREMCVRLRPGELLAFDNHRMLHGRTAFELGARGRRHLLGCYLDLDDLYSRRAVARRSIC